MKKLLLLALLLPLAASAQGLVDRIVAVVNKDVITATELDDAVAGAERQLRRQGTRLPERALLERQMLERLIVDKAQLQLAKDTGLRVDEAQLDRAVQRVAQNNNLSLAEFRGALERDGVPYQAWREDLREQMLLNRLREREVDDKIQVSDTEIDLFLADLKTRPDMRVEYQVAHILVRVPEQSGPERVEAARARAQKAFSEARAGADFASLAASYSDAPDALQGGALGWRSHERLPELFASVLATLQPGQVSDVLRSPAGFHVLKLLERRGQALDGAPVAQTRMRHILIRANEAMSEGEALRQLRDTAYVELRLEDR
jgi:peptidyl-prolyl cis-trans isomerase SurA